MKNIVSCSLPPSLISQCTTVNIILKCNYIGRLFTTMGMDLAESHLAGELERLRLRWCRTSSHIPPNFKFDVVENFFDREKWFFWWNINSDNLLTINSLHSLILKSNSIKYNWICLLLQIVVSMVGNIFSVRKTGRSRKIILWLLLY